VDEFAAQSVDLAVENLASSRDLLLSTDELLDERRQFVTSELGSGRGSMRMSIFGPAIL
jgi:hypothetical protein